jgi:hypothetical protein
MVQHLTIRLGHNGDFPLVFRLRPTELAQLWAERMQHRTAWPLDHPNRFYNFGTAAQERQRAVADIQRCIKTINSHQGIINRPFEYTQDCLNYLHNIFERYHGLLDQQTSPYWRAAPESVRQALAELNLAVHRCESVSAGAQPRFVCTWFGMPKTHTLSEAQQLLHGERCIEFGTVYLNYCEIGKTAEDLANDNDIYIGDDAFRPFSHYSADFNVQFYDRDLNQTYGRVQSYIDQHQEFFLAHGITSVYNTKAQPLRFPVADLEYTGSRQELLLQIAQRQFVHEITLK